MGSMQTITGKWLTRAEAAQYLRVSPRTIDRWAKTGIITRHLVAGVARSSRYLRKELEQMVRP